MINGDSIGKLQVMERKVVHHVKLNGLHDPLLVPI